MNDPGDNGNAVKASDLFVRCLEEEGVTHIYGVPGEENADIMLSLMDSNIEFILCRHEQAAAFAADAFGRLTGRPGVCLATLGPGATNLVTGFADANMDRAPIIALIGQGSTDRLHKESHQNMDAIAMFQPISKWAQSITNPATIPEVIRKAFKISQTEKPGGCVIELPEDVAKVLVDIAPMPVDKTRRPAADHKVVARVVDLISESRNPLILAGNGAVRKRATQQLRRLVGKTGIAVVNTFMGKGAIPLDDPHCLFTIGLQGRDHITAAFEEADLVITVGYDLVEYAPEFWNVKHDKKIIDIDFEPAEIDADFPVSVDVVADIAGALWQINEELNARFDNEGRLPLFDISSRSTLRQIIWDDLTAESEDESFPVKPQKAINVIREALGPSDILLSDVGAHKMWVSRYYQCYEPNTCLISNGFCSMGFALPGAIGAKIAHNELKVLAVSGDAGFLMNVQDLETAVRYKLNFVCVVFVDGEYGLIKWKQQNHFNGRHSELTFDNPDFELLAKAFGMWGRQIESTDELLPAIQEGFTKEGPALIAVPIDYSENRKLTKRLGDLQISI